MEQTQIDEANKKFWSELCGTGLAQSIGIDGNDRASLDKFDRAYLGFYPYLLDFIEPAQMRGREVLEIGLGYGTVSRVIASEGAKFNGLDISDGPVFMSNHSMSMLGLDGKAVRGSALEIPFPNANFDFVVSIGCLHHTGNMMQAFKEVSRVVKPGGRAILMVYNRYSLRQWIRWPLKTTLRWLAETFLRTNKQLVASRREKGAYDANSSGEAAPDTVFTSKSEVTAMLKNAGFSQVRVEKKNSDEYGYRGRMLIGREQALKWIGPILGLDLYIVASK